MPSWSSRRSRERSARTTVSPRTSTRSGCCSLLDNLEQLLLDAAPRIAGARRACPNLCVARRPRATPLRIAGEREYAVDAAAGGRRGRALPRARLRGRARGRGARDLPAPRRAAARDRARGGAHARAARRPAPRSARACASPSSRAAARRARAAADAARDDRLELRPARADRAVALRAARRLRGQLHARGSARTVCGADLDDVESLVEQSLVRRWSSGRLGMLETIAEYARERLEESGEADAVRRHHAEYFLADRRSGEPLAGGGRSRTSNVTSS